ncbi:sensor histidine kinase [Thalassotalea agariperforans]
MIVKLLLLISLLFATGISAGEIVDPRNLKEQQVLLSKAELNLSNWPVARIRQLEERRDRLIKEISQLPRHCPIISDNHLGYHSSLNFDNGMEVSDVHQIDFVFERAHYVESIALVPAFNPLKPYGGSYAFPKRFKIEVETHDGAGFEELVNWLEQDFPNPGSYPAFFNNIDKSFHKLRIIVPAKLESSIKDHFALGEVYIWASDAQTGSIENIASFTSTKVSASSRYEQPSKWQLDYLTDQDTGLGFPIKEQTEAREDVLIIPTIGHELDQAIEILIDLNKPQNISRIDFWPGKPSSNVMLPDFGFPEDIIVEVANEPQFIKPTILSAESTGEKFGTLFSVNANSQKWQYIRIHLTKLQEINKQRILGLGEIAVYDAKGQLLKSPVIKTTGIPDIYLEQLPQLMDGYSWGRQIVPDRDWIMGLAQRRPLDQQLNYVESEIKSAHDYWEWLLVRIIVGSVVVVFLLLISAVLLYQRYQRQHLLLKQGDRINRDLHDEVGSSLGSITLLADELANKNENNVLGEDLDDLALMAREANASLREIVWHNDGKSVYLPQLLQTLFERAQRVLRGVKVTHVVPDNCPNIKISLVIKRHLTLFFKEVIHNCARHSKASELTIVVTIDETALSIEVADNGCGFDLTQSHQGWGLNNLTERAKEIAGEVSIKTKLNQGVSVKLTVNLNMLSKDLERSYQTSN